MYVTFVFVVVDHGGRDGVVARDRLPADPIERLEERLLRVPSRVDERGVAGSARLRDGVERRELATDADDEHGDRRRAALCRAATADRVFQGIRCRAAARAEARVIRNAVGREDDDRLAIRLRAGLEVLRQTLEERHHRRAASHLLGIERRPDRPRGLGWSASDTAGIA